MRRPRIALFTLLVLPSFLVVANYLALSRIRTDNWSYRMSVSAGNVANVTSQVRLAGWPFGYNVAFVDILDENSEPLYPLDNSFEFRSTNWLALLADALIATILGFIAYYAMNFIRCRTSAPVENGDSTPSLHDKINFGDSSC